MLPSRSSSLMDCLRQGLSHIGNRTTDPESLVTRADTLPSDYSFDVKRGRLLLSIVCLMVETIVVGHYAGRVNIDAIFARPSRYQFADAGCLLGCLAGCCTRAHLLYWNHARPIYECCVSTTKCRRRLALGALTCRESRSSILLVSAAHPRSAMKLKITARNVVCSHADINYVTSPRPHENMETATE